MTAIQELAHNLRLQGRYHEALEIELDRFRLRQLGKQMRAEPGPTQVKRYKCIT